MAKMKTFAYWVIDDHTWFLMISARHARALRNNVIIKLLTLLRNPRAISPKRKAKEKKKKRHQGNYLFFLAGLFLSSFALPGKQLVKTRQILSGIIILFRHRVPYLLSAVRLYQWLVFEGVFEADLIENSESSGDCKSSFPNCPLLLGPIPAWRLFLGGSRWSEFKFFNRAAGIRLPKLKI